MLIRPITYDLTRPISVGVAGGGWGGPPIMGGSEIAYLGDSITAAGRISTASEYISPQRGFSTWADVLSSKRSMSEFANNFGVSGDRTDQMAVRVPNVIATGARACVVLGGTNDVSSGVSSATIIANLTGIYDSLNASGLFVIAVPILPRGGASTLTAPQLAVTNAVNAWIRGQAISRSLFRLADPVSDLEDTGAGGYVPLAGMMHDGLHPSAKGAYYVGKAVAIAIHALYSADSSLAILGSLINNPSLTGTGGAKNTVTGSVADGWTAAANNAGGATVVASKITDADGTVWQRITASGTYTGTSRSFYFYQELTAANFLSGDRITAWARVRTGGALTGFVHPSLNLTLGSFAARECVTTSLTDDVTSESFDGVLRSFPITLPANSAAPQLLFNMALRNTATTDPCSGYVEFAMVGIRKE